MKTENSPPVLSKHGKQITGLCKTAFSPSGPFLCPGRLPHSLVLLYTRFGTLAVGVSTLFGAAFAASQPSVGPFQRVLSQQTLAAFSEFLENGTSRIAVAENGGKIVGFCKADIHGVQGKPDYPVALPECRGRGKVRVPDKRPYPLVLRRITSPVCLLLFLDRIPSPIVC